MKIPTLIAENGKVLTFEGSWYTQTSMSASESTTSFTLDPRQALELRAGTDG